VTKAMRRSAERARVERFLEQRTREKAEEFRRHWGGFFDAAGRERWWTGYLERQARTPHG
jgi:hypothetical protein